MTEIADLIFDSNSTLYEVLDNLDVPNLTTVISTLTTKVDSLTEQLRQLGIVVDSNNTTTNTRIITLTTEVDGLTLTLNNLLTQVTSLNLTVVSHGNSITSLQTQISNLNSTVNQQVSTVNTLSTNVAALTTTVGNLVPTVSGHTNQIASLTTTVNSHTTSIASLTSTVNSHTTSITNLNNRMSTVETRANIAYNAINDLPISLRELYYSSAYLVAGAIYRVVNQVSTNYYQRQLIIYTPAEPLSLRMGMVLKGNIEGVNWDYIMFSDNVTASAGASFQTQFGMIPVGGPITLRYGSSASSYTIAQVRVTKQYFR